MVKLSKFYIIFACAALCLFGCGRTEENITDSEAAAESTAVSENMVLTANVEAVSIEETEASEEEETEEVLTPVMADGFNYMSTDGIVLEPGLEFAMVATNSSNSFYTTLKQGAAAAVSDLNELYGYTGKQKIKLSFDAPSEENIIDQINIIDQFLDKAPDALCIAFTDATAGKTQIQMAKNNGISLIAFDTPDDSKSMEALVATDNVAAATEAADKMFEAVDDGAKIAVIVHNSETQTGQDRYRAITNEAVKNYSDKNLRFVDIIYLAQDDRTEEEILNELLEKYPDLSGIICTDLMTTEMVIDYAKNLEERTFEIVGFDASEKIVNAVSDGTILGTVAQDPYSMGYATIIAAARSIAGLDNAENIHTRHLWIDSSNLDSEEAQSLLKY